MKKETVTKHDKHGNDRVFAEDLSYFSGLVLVSKMRNKRDGFYYRLGRPHNSKLED